MPEEKSPLRLTRLSHFAAHTWAPPIQSLPSVHCVDLPVADRRTCHASTTRSAVNQLGSVVLANGASFARCVVPFPSRRPVPETPLPYSQPRSPARRSGRAQARGPVTRTGLTPTTPYMPASISLFLAGAAATTPRLPPAVTPLLATAAAKTTTVFLSPAVTSPLAAAAATATTLFRASPVSPVLVGTAATSTTYPSHRL